MKTILEEMCQGLVLLSQDLIDKHQEQPEVLTLELQERQYQEMLLEQVHRELQQHVQVLQELQQQEQVEIILVLKVLLVLLIADQQEHHQQGIIDQQVLVDLMEVTQEFHELQLIRQINLVQQDLEVHILLVDQVLHVQGLVVHL